MPGTIKDIAIDIFINAIGMRPVNKITPRYAFIQVAGNYKPGIYGSQKIPNHPILARLRIVLM